ncbi:uncharacterized protein LOC144505582 [Mustelus asterias]
MHCNGAPKQGTIHDDKLLAPLTLKPRRSQVNGEQNFNKLIVKPCQQLGMGIKAEVYDGSIFKFLRNASWLPKGLEQLGNKINISLQYSLCLQSKTAVKAEPHGCSQSGSVMKGALLESSCVTLEPAQIVSLKAEGCCWDRELDRDFTTHNMATEKLAEKRRSQNFPKKDLDTLLREVEQRKTHILGRGKFKPPRKIQSKAWKEVAEILSANSEVPRTADQCRKKVNDLMRSARAKQAHNVRECSLNVGDLPFLKDLTLQEERAWKLLGLSNPGVGSGDVDFGLSQDATVTAQQSAGECHAAPEVAAGKLKEASSAQQCSTEAAAEEGEALQQDISDFDSDVHRVRVVEEGEVCNDMAAVSEEEHSEPSGADESSSLAEDSPTPPERQLLFGSDDADELLIRQLSEVVMKTAERYEASARNQDEQLQRIVKGNAQQMQILQQVHELVRQRNDISLQRNELLRQQNEFLQQIINKVVTPDAAPSGQEPIRSETVAAEQDAAPSGMQETTSRERVRRRCRRN